MSEKRRDNKGRILKDGETQRKDGRYEYKYTDEFGGRHSVYSWKLVETDKIPIGARQTPSLRALESDISRDELNGINHSGAKLITLNEMFERYYKIHNHLKRSTWVGYISTYNNHVKNSIGKLPIGKIRYSDIKTLYLDMITKKKIGIGMVSIVHNMLHPVFDFAIREQIINYNPSDGIVSEIRKQLKITDTHKRAMTESEQRKFVNYISTNDHFMFLRNFVIAMLGTGMRIGEMVGLIDDDCDFENNIIHVRRTMTYNSLPGNKTERHLTPPKSVKSVRDIPMLSDVKAALLSQMKHRDMILSRLCNKDMIEVDGISGFIFISSTLRPMSAQYINSVLHRVVDKYNEDEKELAKIEKREPEYLPQITSHTFRHSFCTRLCENCSDIKVVQEVMGHTRVTTTLDVYTESSIEKKVLNFSTLEGKIPLS